MLGDADATASAGDEDPLKADLKIGTTLANLQKGYTGSATATEEELMKNLQTAKDVRKRGEIYSVCNPFGRQMERYYYCLPCDRFSFIR